MISEGDWSNDAENSDLITGINLRLKIYSNRKLWKLVFDTE